MPALLHDSLLQFDRGGHHLLVVDPAGIAIIDLRRGAIERNECHGAARHELLHRARAVAGFSDQVWVVTLGDVLLRFDLSGRWIGEPITLPSCADATLVPAPCGSAGAIWSAAPAVGFVDDLGSLAQHAHAAADLVIPFTARRAIAVFGARVQLPSGLHATLPPGCRVLGGQVLADGKSAALITANDGRRLVSMVQLGTGQAIARGEIAPAPIRIASRRAIAVVAAEGRRIEVVDLRAGRELGSFVLDREPDELAIDPDGLRLAVRTGHEVELVDLVERLRERPRPVEDVAGAQMTQELAPVPARRLARASEPVVAVGDIGNALANEVANEVARDVPNDVAIELTTEPLIALAPCRPAPLPKQLARASLELEREMILARGLAGIASGWDTRRLGYANESAHPFELEVAALLGASHGHAASHVTEAERRLEVARKARTNDRARHFSDSPLGKLAHELDLTSLEVDILMAVAAPTLWGEIARLYAVLANDPGRGIVDELLVGQLLGPCDRYAVAAALGPDATLRRHGVLLATSERPRPFTHLAINPIVAARLCGEALPLPDTIVIRDANTPLAELVVPMAPLAKLLAELARPPARPPRIVVRGRRGSGRRSVLAAIASRAHRSLGVIDLEQLPADDPAPVLRSWLRSASLCGLLPCLVGTAREPHARAIGDAIAMHPGPIAAALGADEACPFPAGHLELILPTLTATQRLVHWQSVLARHAIVVADLENLAGRYRLTPGMAERAAEHVARAAPTHDATRALEDAIRQGRDDRLSRLATRVTRLPCWSDVVLPPDVLDSLRELIGRVQHGRRVYEDWGFDAVMTTGRGLTALFDGRPGTGKTMVAGIIARELGLDLYRVDVSRLVSKWIGETEKNLAEIFDAVDDGQAIILFDEADSLFGKRTEVKSSNDRYANLEVNYLLQRIDSFDGIAVLTTNFGSAIDPAFRRRVSFRLSFPFPDEEAREQLWRVHLPPKLPIEGELDLSALARKFQLAGGYIRNACLRAAFLAAQEETAVSQRHLERAVQLEYQQTGKISTSGPVE